MKLPIPLLLYLVSMGLFGLAGWTVYQMLPMWSEGKRQEAHNKGLDEGNRWCKKGRDQGPKSSAWIYSPENRPWWLTTANLVGKLPPPPVDPTKPAVDEKPVLVDERPLEQVIELVSLVYDGPTGGKGGSSHVVVRFKPEANVQPPEWWVKENTIQAANASVPVAGPRDVTKPAPGRPAPPAGKPVVGRPGAATPMPVSSSPFQGPVLQKLWAQDEGDPRRSAVLWPIRSNDGREVGKIRLVRVEDDAQAAVFVRELPPPKAGAEAPPPKEETLIKTTVDLSQDLLHALREMQGRAVTRTQSGTSKPAVSTSWVDVQTTTRINGTWHVGRDDNERFQTQSDTFFDTLNVDTYQGRNGTRGVIVKGIDPQVAASYGISPGEVLIEMNGRKIESKAQAISLGKGDYQRGVRTFQTKWLSNGQVVERTYQAPQK